MSSTESQTRERILKETWRLMEEKHGQGVRMADIARAVGISRQAVYLHFPSRTDLLVATARYVDQIRGLEERLQPLRTEQNPIKMLDVYIDFWGNYIPEIYGLAKALLSVRDTDEAANVAWNDRMEYLRSGSDHIVGCLAKEGKLAPGWTQEQAADMLWSISNIGVWENLCIDLGWTVGEYVSYMQRVVRLALTADE